MTQASKPRSSSNSTKKPTDESPATTECEQTGGDAEEDDEEDHEPFVSHAKLPLSEGVTMTQASKPRSSSNSTKKLAFDSPATTECEQTGGDAEEDHEPFVSHAKPLSKGVTMTQASKPRSSSNSTKKPTDDWPATTEYKQTEDDEEEQPNNFPELDKQSKKRKANLIITPGAHKQKKRVFWSGLEEDQ